VAFLFLQNFVLIKIYSSENVIFACLQKILTVVTTSVVRRVGEVLMRSWESMICCHYNLNINNFVV